MRSYLGQKNSRKCVQQNEQKKWCCNLLAWPVCWYPVPLRDKPLSTLNPPSSLLLKRQSLPSSFFLLFFPHSFSFHIHNLLNKLYTQALSTQCILLSSAQVSGYPLGDLPPLLGPVSGHFVFMSDSTRFQPQEAKEIGSFSHMVLALESRSIQKGIFSCCYRKLLRQKIWHGNLCMEVHLRR